MPFTAPDAWRQGDLLLRSFQPGDGPELNRATQSSLEHLRPWMAWASPGTTVEDSEAFARESFARWLLGEEFGVAVWRGERLVAATGFHLRGPRLADAAAEIGMWVRADEAGRGLGTRVLRAMVDWADAALSLMDGLEAAARSIDEGRARQALDAWVEASRRAAADA